MDEEREAHAREVIREVMERRGISDERLAEYLRGGEQPHDPNIAAMFGEVGRRLWEEFDQQ